MSGRQLLRDSVHTLDVHIKLPVGRQTLVHSQDSLLGRGRRLWLAYGKLRRLLLPKTARLFCILPEDGQQLFVLQLAKYAPHPRAPDLQASMRLSASMASS